MRRSKRKDTVRGLRTTESWWKRIGKLIRIVFILLLPGLIAVASLLSATAIGPTAFAIRVDFPISIAQIGLSFTLFFLSSALFAGVGAWAMGRWRLMVIIRVSLSLTAIVTFVMSFAQSAVAMMVFCVVAGMVNGVVTPTVNVLITRLIPLKLRGLAFGVKVAAAPLASALAAMGAWAAANHGFPWRALYWFGAALGILVMIGTFFLGLPRRQAARKAQPKNPESLSARRKRSLLLLGVGGLIGASGTGVVSPFLVDGLIDHGMNAGRAASLLGIGSIVGFLARVLVGALSDKWPRPIAHLNAVGVMLGIAGISMLFLGIGQTDVVLTSATIMFFALGWGWPGLVHYAVLVTHSEAPAMATTYMQIGTFLGAVLGPMGFGLIAQYGSFTSAWLISAISVLSAALILSWGTKRLAKDLGGAPAAVKGALPPPARRALPRVSERQCQETMNCDSSSRR